MFENCLPTGGGARTTLKQLEPNLFLSFVYQSAAHRNPQSLKQWRDNVTGWKRLGAQMVVREGWGNHYYFDLPFLHYSQIMANLAEAQRLGFIAAYDEGSRSGGKSVACPIPRRTIKDGSGRMTR